MDAQAARTRFYELVQQHDPTKPLDDGATAFARRYHKKLQGVCAQMVQFDQPKAKNRAVRAATHRAAPESESAQVVQEDGNRNAQQMERACGGNTSAHEQDVPIQTAQRPRIPLSEQERYYWLLRLIAQEEPWAQAQQLASWERLTSAHPFLNMTAPSAQLRFYTLITLYKPMKCLDDSATDLATRFYKKLRKVCVQLGQFEQQRAENSNVLAEFDRAAAELESCHVVHGQRFQEARGGGEAGTDATSLDEFLAGPTQRLPVESSRTRLAATQPATEEEETPPAVSAAVADPLPNLEEMDETPSPSASDGLDETPIELALPDSDSDVSDAREEIIHPSNEVVPTRKRRREDFCERQKQLLRAQARIDKLQALLYTDLLAKQPQNTLMDRRSNCLMSKWRCSVTRHDSMSASST